MERPVYNRSQLNEKIGDEGVRHLLQHRLVPLYTIDDEVWYDAAYIDGLVAKLDVMALDRPREYLAPFAHLYYLEYQHLEKTNLTGITDYQRQPLIQPITSQLETMLKSGKVVPLTYLINQLVIITPSTFYNWAKKGSLVTAFIGNSHYLLKSYVERCIWALLECEKVVEAAPRLNIKRTTLEAAVNAGRVSAFLGPDGLWRIDPQKVTQVDVARRASGWVKPKDGRHTLEEMADRLNVAYSTVRKAVAADQIELLPMVLAQHFVSEEQVARWEQSFTTLQQGFEWLQPLLGQDPWQVETYNLDGVSRRLGIGLSTARRWHSVLPHYLRSFGRQANRYFFVKRYIDSLVVAVGKPVGYDAACDYAKCCSATGAIL